MQKSNHYEKRSDYGISKERLNAILFLAGDVNGKKIAEFGCGNGFLLGELKKKGSITHGYDVSNTAVANANETSDKAIVFDVEKDDFSKIEDKYDLVIASELIEHLFYPEKFFENVKKILNPKGEVIITTPNFLMWSNRIKMFLGKFEYRETGFWDRGHIHFFTYYSLKKMLNENGYQILAEKNIPYRCPPIFAKIIPGVFIFQMVFKLKNSN